MQVNEAYGGATDPSSASASASDEASNVCNFFRKPLTGMNIRKRTAIEEVEDEVDDSKVVYNKKNPGAAYNKLRFCSGPVKSSKESELEKTKGIFNTAFEIRKNKKFFV